MLQRASLWDLNKNRDIASLIAVNAANWLKENYGKKQPLQKIAVAGTVAVRSSALRTPILLRKHGPLDCEAIDVHL